MVRLCYTDRPMKSLNHQQPLAGKTAIITGAGRGAGAAMALALAQAGARLCVSDINPDRAKRIAAQITEAGGEAFAFQADVSNKFQVSALIETTRDRYQTLDIFVHHAHISPSEPLLKQDEWELRRTLDVNLIGTFFCIQLAARVMSDESGGLILVATQPVDAMGAGHAVLAASQTGVLGMIRVVADELTDTSVRVETLTLSTPDAAVDHLMALCLPKES